MALRRVLPSRVNQEPQEGAASAQPQSAAPQAAASQAPSLPPAPKAEPTPEPAPQKASSAAAAMALLDEPVLPPVVEEKPAPQDAPEPALAPEPQPESKPEPKAESKPQLPAPEAPAVFAAEAETPIPSAPQKPLSESQSADESTPREPLPVARPDNAGGNLRRKVEARKRSFELPSQKQEEQTAAPASPAAPEPKPQPATPKNVNERGVPINTTPLDQVDDRLAEAGVIAAEVDPLTSRAPVGLAETEAPLPAWEEPSFDAPSLSIPPLPASPEPKAVPTSSASLEPTPALSPLPALPPIPQLAPQAATPTPVDLSVPDLPAPEGRPAKIAPEFSLASNPAAAKSSAPVPDLPPVASDLPWSNTPAGDGWDFATGTPEEPQPYSPEASSTDIFKNLPQPHMAPTPGLPFSSAPASPTLPPPELPGGRSGSSGGGKGGGSAYVIMGAAAVAAVILGAYWLVSSKAPQNAAQWAKNSVIQTPSPTNAALGPSGTMLMPPRVDGMAQNSLFPATASSSAVINFSDVPPDQAGQPIVADGTEKMPNDISLVAKLQQAVAERKAQEQGGISASTPAATTNDASENAKLKAQLDQELAAYRKALAEASGAANTPTPGKFLKDTGMAVKTDSEGAPIAQPTSLPLPAQEPGPMGVASTTPATDTPSTDGLLPPPSSAAGLPPASLYTHNPKNLPIMAEPTAAEQPKVRTLDEFNVSMFEPEKDKVRIPRGLKPKISTTDFPEVELLSLVPGKGIIAYYQGKEGVLLLGESLDGWELSMVKADTAEFKNGDKTHYISAE